MNKEFVYEGKAKIIYKVGDNVVIHYKDDATAFNGKKKDVINNKGIINNSISSIIYSILHKHNIPTHFIEKLSEREQLCEEVDIIPLEVIVRNTVAGSMAKRLGLDEGVDLDEVVLEICYKNDELNDPLINDYHALALNLCNRIDLDYIYDLALRINDILKELFESIGIKLVDMKFEFGVTNYHKIVLADEITPDTCRLWDLKTNEKLDKDRFRRELGNVEDAYIEILKRLEQL